MAPDQLFAHFKRLTTTLSGRQLFTLAAAFIAVVAVVGGSAYWVNSPSYALLFTDLDPESAGAVVTRLKADKVDYTLDDGGRTVRVPSNKVDELRLAFASSGLPTTGRIGFEIFDRTAFGTTEFLEHINYRRGLEGELARTIATISEVASARVHIALAKDSLLTAQAEQAKASVVLKLRTNKPPSAATIAGIAGLVASSVESLRAESVVILDTFGRPLTRTSGAEIDAASGAPLERQQRIERDLAARVVALLEPVVGPGHVRVNVSAALNASSSEETEERWDPTTVVRSRQSSSDANAASAAQGVAGARANAPPNASTSTAAAANASPASALPATVLTTAGTNGRTSETTNYEVSKLSRHTIAPSGEIARLSVAVIIDDERTVSQENGQNTVVNKPRDAKEIERIQRLVSTAVGLDAERGDQVTVENMAFEEVPLEEAPPPSGWLEKVAPRVTERLDVIEVVRVVAVLILGLMALLMIVRPMAKSLMSVPAITAGAAAGAAALASAKTVADLEGEIEAELDAQLGGLDSRRMAVLTKRVSQRATQEPEHVARLIRSWVSDDKS